ncbi:MAG: hypothetical protein N2745_10950 [Syntrophorhabdaceae bacterium]|nr:hypothetical protein [Syntrophorhabdaceae bacterium]
MEVIYLFSSQKGDVILNEEMLSMPFIVRPFENHPFMNLKDFFDATRDFVIMGERVFDLYKGHAIPVETKDDIKELKIRYEKYGTLYHIAKVEINTEKGKKSFAVSAAIWPNARQVMAREFPLLLMLNEKKTPSYLPDVYNMGKIKVERDGRWEIMTFMLSTWFEGYDEWHFHTDDRWKDSAIIWDMGQGERRLSEHETYELIKKATYILTYYYEMEGGYRITSWHHGAGDFIVKADGKEVDVRLVAAREFRPFFFMPGDKKNHPFKALSLFLIETTVKMRLDREGGVGKRYMAGVSLLEAVMEGFLKGMADKEKRGEMGGITSKEVASKLKAMGESEAMALLNDFLGTYRMEDPEEALFLEPHKEEHLMALMTIFKAL